MNPYPFSSSRTRADLQMELHLLYQELAAFDRVPALNSQSYNPGAFDRVRSVAARSMWMSLVVTLGILGLLFGGVVALILPFFFAKTPWVWVMFITAGLSVGAVIIFLFLVFAGTWFTHKQISTAVNLTESHVKNRQVLLAKIRDCEQRLRNTP